VASAAGQILRPAKLAPGAVLRAPDWASQGAAVTAYQWQRNGQPIKGATAASYTLTGKDLNTGISLLATATVEGQAAQLHAPPIHVPKAKPALTAKPAAKALKAGQRAKIKVRIKIPGIAKPAGAITVRYGKPGQFKTKTYTLKPSAKGKATITLPKLAKGRHTIAIGLKASQSWTALANSKTPKPTKALKNRVFQIKVT
jgi:hypothetical protein